MSDSSTTQVIFFVAAIVVAASLSGVFIGLSANMAQAVEKRAINFSDKLDTSIKIINDPAFMPYQASNLTLYVKNTGARQMLPTDLLVMIDGKDQNSSSWSIIGGSNLWGPSIVLQIHLNIILANGDHTAKVVISNGISDSIGFRI
jgi:archaellum component FlaG (FlaF/FlaG flagellin family)